MVMRELVEITKALGDENRLRILHALIGRELCVCQIVALLDLAASTVSQHISVLRHARLVESRKDGRWVHYRLAGEGEGAEAARALKWLKEALPRQALLKQDAQRIKQILKRSLEEVCQGL